MSASVVASRKRKRGELMESHQRTALFIALGTRGDVEPLLHVAREAIKENYTVLFLTHSSHAALITESIAPKAEPRGFGGFRPLWIRSPALLRGAFRTVDPRATQGTTLRVNEWREIAEEARRETSVVDVVVSNLAALSPSVHLADAYAARYVCLSPCLVPYPAQAASGGGSGGGGGGGEGNASWMWPAVHSAPHRQFRSDYFPELPALSLTSPVVQSARLLIGVAGVLAEAGIRALTRDGGVAPGVPPCACAVGPWKRPSDDDDDNEQGPLPASLIHFLEEGPSVRPVDGSCRLRPRVVFLGFGSTDPTMREAAWGEGHDLVVKRIVAASRLLGYRVVTQQQPEPPATSQDDTPAANDVFSLCAPVSHIRLFEKVSIAVHHGGAGTTHACAMAGCPQVIVPVQFDNSLWGEAVEELGVGRALHVESGTTREEALVAPSVGDAAKALRAAGGCVEAAGKLRGGLRGCVQRALDGALEAMRGQGGTATPAVSNLL